MVGGDDGGRWRRSWIFIIVNVYLLSSIYVILCFEPLKNENLWRHRGQIVPCSAGILYMGVHEGKMEDETTSVQ